MYEYTLFLPSFLELSLKFYVFIQKRRKRETLHQMETSIIFKP
uniref:Uncharacterized protein n=1 Tax=Rhizophora mucronata TaxID=61149 RepID=A0A2P2PHZ1_RHIMU